MNTFPFSSPLADFDMATFFSNAESFVEDCSRYGVVICGIILIIVAVYRLADGLMHGGKTHWGITIACLAVGGFFAIDGYSQVFNFGKTMLESELTALGSVAASSPAAGGTPAATGGIDLSAFFGILGTQIGTVANGIAMIAGILLIISGCIQLTKLLTKPRPAPLPIWAWAVLTLCVGGMIQSGWWNTAGSSALTANGWAKMIQSTVSDIGKGSYSGGGSGATITPNDASLNGSATITPGSLDTE